MGSFFQDLLSVVVCCYALFCCNFEYPHKQVEYASIEKLMLGKFTYNPFEKN